MQIEQIYKPEENSMTVAVFLSGSGTNFEAIYNEQLELEKNGDGNYGKIEVVFTNVSACRGAEKAKSFGIPVVSLSSRAYFDILAQNPSDDEIRDYYDAAAISLLEEICEPDLIVLAGFRRKLGSLFLNRYKNKVVNLYPGDTTKQYLVRGIEAYVQALRAEETEIKCTVFFQRDDKRFGPSIVQSNPISLDGFNEENRDELHHKIREEGEWLVFPFAIHHLIAKGRVGIDGEDNVYVDGKKMPLEGFQFQKSQVRSQNS